MVDQPFSRTLRSHCAKQCPQHQFLRHSGIQGVADQLAIEQILDAGKVEPAVVGGDVGYVAHPGFVWGRHSELPIQQVRRHRQRVIGIRGRLEFPLLLAAKAEFLANPSDAMIANLDAVVGKVGLQTLRTVGLPGTLMGGLDLDFQPGIL